MPTNFPASIDAFTRPVADAARNVAPAETVCFDNAFDAVEALETKVGTTAQSGTPGGIIFADASGNFRQDVSLLWDGRLIVDNLFSTARALVTPSLFSDDNNWVGDAGIWFNNQFSHKAAIGIGNGNHLNAWVADTHCFKLDANGDFDLVSGQLLVAGTQVVGAQGAAVANATDAASAITQLNALLARCRTHGLIAT